MAPTLFSSILTPLEGEIENKKLKKSIEELSSHFRKTLKKLVWDEKHIAIPISVSVDLPPRGNIDKIDVRSNEPVLIVFDLNGYPSKAPKVFPDRTNFPKNQLAHGHCRKDKT